MYVIVTIYDVSVATITWVVAQRFFHSVTTQMIVAKETHIKVFQGDILECGRSETALLDVCFSKSSKQD